MTTFYDVAIVGAGPAGLSAALLLARSRRRVAVFDHDQPRNQAAVAVHGYLGLDGIEPTELRRTGRRECESYGVEFVDEEVVRAKCLESDSGSRFELETAAGRTLQSRKLLIASGVKDKLPNVPNIKDYYGHSVHHCPYCDGWEHKDERLVALGDAKSVADLAMTLRVWSENITVCTNGQSLSADDRKRLESAGVECRQEVVSRLEGEEHRLRTIEFDSGPPLECDALFFSGEKTERSKLPAMLGCECDENGVVDSKAKQGSGVPGLFIAGDADGDVQFAIVAAAEGAIAATAINKELVSEAEKPASGSSKS